MAGHQTNIEKSMKQTSLFWSSLGRAFAHIWHPRMLLLTLVPFVLCGVLLLGAYFLFWEDAVAGMKAGLDSSQMLQTAYSWMTWMGFKNANAFLAPLLVVALSVPPMVVLSLLVVSLVALPQALKFVADRKFPSLEKRGKAAIVQSAISSLGWTVIAIIALICSIPLWFIPPLFMILPPLIWGWLTYKVMSFDALADHASTDERRSVISNHKTSLLTMGVLTGLIGAAPSLLWVGSIATVILFPLISLIALWLYTVGFVFTALWFVHYCLAALTDERGINKSMEAFSST
jgi:Etoposide-induced protein 2.4 (EI24)